ncbi:MAG: PKD domain-containing protein [Crocinitomicaceae bacterium]|nr:PKD domain-containing protein [Crocinitomicaceae bacterium]
MIRNLILILSLSSLAHYSQAQMSKKVLFIGNSYTSANNLPQMVKDVTLSAGDDLIFDANSPGGQTLQNHSTNASTLAKIQVGGWDYVVLQEQSQLPAFPDGQVISSMYPYAKYLDSIVNAYNTCAETIFYMTWGRKNGDAANCGFFPPLCTYQGMDSLIALRYRYVAVQNNAILSPAGAVWKYLRANNPNIELYVSDESHPSEAGTYAAACAFYTTIFKKDPTLITFNSTLSATDAEAIRNAAKVVVYNNQSEWLFDRYNPVSTFGFTINGNAVTFNNTSTNADISYWNFGDGNTSTDLNPVHTYATVGSYDVTLISKRCSGEVDTTIQSVEITTLSTNKLEEKLALIVYPNPAQDFISISSTQQLQPAYRILNAQGKVILTGELNLESKLIDIRTLRNGIYFIDFFQSEMTRIQFVKN